MEALILFLTLSTVLAATPFVSACKGCVSLDEYNFDKLVSRFKAVLVKFDAAYPYGDKHESFAKLAEEISGVQDILIGQVGVKDYGDKENEGLANKYGAETKEDLPMVKLFVQGLSKPVDFPKDAEWTVDNIRNLIRDNTDIYIGLPGCLEKYDKLAMEFVKAGNKEKKLKDVEKVVEAEKEPEKITANTYVLFMKRIVSEGVSFINQELTRLGKILKDGKVNDKKKEELTHRLNILHSFALPTKVEL